MIRYKNFTLKLQKTENKPYNTCVKGINNDNHRKLVINRTIWETVREIAEQLNNEHKLVSRHDIRSDYFILMKQFIIIDPIFVLKELIEQPILPLNLEVKEIIAAKIEVYKNNE